MALVLETPKTAFDLMSLLPACDSLNSLQLRAVLVNYQPEPGEMPLSSDVINQLAEVAAKQVDEQLLADGRKVVVSEPLDLQLPFLLPEDGYSCDYVKGMPPGLAEFTETFVLMGMLFSLKIEC
jgi:afadin